MMDFGVGFPGRAVALRGLCFAIRPAFVGRGSLREDRKGAYYTPWRNEGSEVSLQRTGTSS